MCGGSRGVCWIVTRVYRRSQKGFCLTIASGFMGSHLFVNLNTLSAHGCMLCQLLGNRHMYLNQECTRI